MFLNTPLQWRNSIQPHHNKTQNTLSIQKIPISTSDVTTHEFLNLNMTGPGTRSIPLDKLNARNTKSFGFQWRRTGISECQIGILSWSTFSFWMEHVLYTYICTYVFIIMMAYTSGNKSFGFLNWLVLLYFYANPHWATAVINAQTCSVWEETFGQKWPFKVHVHRPTSYVSYLFYRLLMCMIWCCHFGIQYRLQSITRSSRV